MGAESLNHSSSVLVSQILKSHIEMIRNHRSGCFINSKIIIIPESNLPAIAFELRAQIKLLNIPNVMFMNENYSSKLKEKSNYKMVDLPGSRTTRETKPLMVEMLIKKLKKNNIVFYFDLIQAQVDLCNLKHIKIEIADQMKSFSKIKIMSNDPDIGTKIIYHGKSQGGNDDFVMGIMINIYNASRFFIEDQFKNERKKTIMI